MDIEGCTSENLLDEEVVCDKEYLNSHIEREIIEIKSQIEELKLKKLMTTKTRKTLKLKMKKAIILLRLHIQNYQRIVVFNRRRARQRLRRRQCTLRNIFLQSLIEMQIRFVEMLPLAIEPRVLVHNYVNDQNIEEFLIPNHIYYKNKHSTSNELDFYHDIISKFTTDQWLDTFHMSERIFKLICDRLKTSLDGIDMDVEHWIVMCIYMFASGNRFCSIATLFNVEKNFVKQSIVKFSKCLLNKFSDKMSMPSSKDELCKITHGFQKASNLLPCVSGVLSLFNIPNDCDCARSTLCRSEGIKVQVCVDNRLLFRKVETTCHKPTMFLKSPDEIRVDSKIFSNNCTVPYFIVAPDNYPLRNCLMSKYNKPCEPWEYNFNKFCSSLNIYRHVSLKRLLGRWHILDLNECILHGSKSFIVKACCILHNIVEENEEYFSIEWCKNFDPAKYECRLTASSTEYFTDSISALEKRNHIAKLMCSNNI